MRNSLSSPKILKTADFQTYDCNIHTHNELELSPLDMNSKKKQILPYTISRYPRKR